MIGTNHPRFQQALWYAWGQQDAGIGKDVDAAEFARQHAIHAQRCDDGEVSYLPSIQDAWRAFLPMADDKRVTVAGFLDGLIAGGSTNMVDDR